MTINEIEEEDSPTSSTKIVVESAVVSPTDNQDYLFGLSLRGETLPF
jgi:hypothetical protein